MDEAPMLYINEKVGTNNGEEFDIAVDPLEGTNFTAKNLPNALSVLAATRKGNLLRAPDMYMEKIAIGKNLPNKILDLDLSVKENIKLLAEAKNVKTSDLTACVLKRPRHDEIIKSFEEIAEIMKKIFNKKIIIKKTKRSSPMPHNGYRAFDSSLVSKSFPDFRFTDILEGLNKLL